MREFADEFEKDAAASTPDRRKGANGQPWRKEVVVGVVLNGAAKAYPLATIRGQSPILDTVGGVNLLVVMSEDKKSVRVFESSVGGRDLEFYMKPGEKAPLSRSGDGQRVGFQWPLYQRPPGRSSTKEGQYPD